MGQQETDPLVGQTLDQYFFERKLGQGGNGQVYLAADVDSGRRVALKLLRAELRDEIEPDERELTTRRFSREVWTAQSLCHPNLIQVLDYRADSRLGPYFAMEYLEGETLKQRWKRERPLPKEDLMAIFGQVAAGLAKIHEEEIVYRDLKPGNIYLVPIYRHVLVKLLDFGIALLPRTKRLTRRGELVGTPQYMSPEQILDPMNISPRSDIYSFGVLFYYMLTGSPLFQAKTPTEIFRMHCQNNKPLKHPAVTPPLRKALASMLLVDPQQRPSTIQEAWGALEQALEGGWSAASLLRSAPAVAAVPIAHTITVDDETQVHLATPKQEETP